MKNISAKIEPHIIETILLLDDCALNANIPFFLIGAGARDLNFTALFDIPTPRGTLDIDFAVRVTDWSQYESLVAALLLSGNVRRDMKMSHRFVHKNGTLVDIIPFGALESPKGVISWPPAGDLVMSTVGFEDSFKSSEIVRIANNPICDVRLCTPAGLATMKLISWDHAYPERNNDAKDIHFILTNYVDAGNEERLYDSDKDIAQSEDFDFSMASPRLLGRDIAAIAGEKTLEEILRILENETKDSSGFRLAQQMRRVPLSRDDELEKSIELLRQLMQGLAEGIALKRR